jgi:hypothetical protein
MQTPPSTPAPTVAPGAPRRPLLIKRSKSTPALSAEDKAALMPQLRALREKHAPRVLELAVIAIQAMRELRTLEDTMDDEARALYPHYVRDLQDYKLTFEHDYPERAEEYDDDGPFLENALLVVEAMETEAYRDMPPLPAA